jgi:arylsulfatase A-like enzyme
LVARYQNARTTGPRHRNPAGESNGEFRSTVWSEDGATLHRVAVRTEKWRYVGFGPDGADGAMLFDAKTDPLEMKNLADDPKFAHVLAELSALTRKYAANPGKTQV